MSIVTQVFRGGRQGASASKDASHQADDLSVTPRTCMVEEERQRQKIVL